MTHEEIAAQIKRLERVADLLKVRSRGQAVVVESMRLHLAMIRLSHHVLSEISDQQDKQPNLSRLFELVSDQLTAGFLGFDQIQTAYGGLVLTQREQKARREAMWSNLQLAAKSLEVFSIGAWHPSLTMWSATD